jgi:hypothetical protein
VWQSPTKSFGDKLSVDPLGRRKEMKSGERYWRFGLSGESENATVINIYRLCENKHNR